MIEHLIEYVALDASQYHYDEGYSRLYCGIRSGAYHILEITEADIALLKTRATYKAEDHDGEEFEAQELGEIDEWLILLEDSNYFQEPMFWVFLVVDDDSRKTNDPIHDLIWLREGFGTLEEATAFVQAEVQSIDIEGIQTNKAEESGEFAVVQLSVNEEYRYNFSSYTIPTNELEKFNFVQILGYFETIENANAYRNWCISRCSKNYAIDDTYFRVVHHLIAEAMKANHSEAGESELEDNSLGDGIVYGLSSF